jgi:hypothetical protein
MRGLTSTILLVVVLAGLGGYIYFVDSKRPIANIEDKEKVFAFETEKLEEIRVTSENESTVLRKTNGTWRIAEPEPGDADQTEVSSLTTNLTNLEVNRVIEDNAADLAKYGLAAPRIKVAYKAEGGATGEIHLGEKTATQSDLYAVKAGEKRVFLVSAFQETTFAKKPFDLRDKRILNFERDKVDTVEIAQGTSSIQLARSGSDWTVKQPVQAAGDYSAVEGLLTRLASANMTKLVDGTDLASYGLDKPQATVTVGAGSSRAVLAIGKEEDGAVYARDQGRGLVFTVDPTLAADLKKPVDDYRDKEIFKFRNFNVSGLRITRGSETIEFQKVTAPDASASDKWQRVNQGGTPTDLDSVQMDDLLSKLTALRAASFSATTQSTGVDQPLMVVAASFDNGKYERVRFGKAGADAFARRDGEPGAAKLEAATYDEVVSTLDALLKPKPTT